MNSRRNWKAAMMWLPPLPACSANRNRPTGYILSRIYIPEPIASTMSLCSRSRTANSARWLPGRVCGKRCRWGGGLPISALILALLAIPLGYVNPRAGRSLNLALAIVLYMLYSNMISVTNAWVGQGKLSPGIGLWGLHTAMLAITLLMFYRRMTLF